jgi:hypothetical protein
VKAALSPAPIVAFAGAGPAKDPTLAGPTGDVWGLTPLAPPEPPLLIVTTRVMESPGQMLAGDSRLVSTPSWAAGVRVGLALGLAVKVAETVKVGLAVPVELGLLKLKVTEEVAVPVSGGVGVEVQVAVTVELDVAVSLADTVRVEV